MNVNKGLVFPIDHQRGRGRKGSNGRFLFISNNFNPSSSRTSNQTINTLSSKNKAQSSNSSKLFISPKTPIGNVYPSRSSSSSNKCFQSYISRTPQSSSTIVTDSDNSHIILAISEGRGQAREEVGIASIDVRRPQLILYQVSDTQGYTNTLRFINIVNPIVILVPSTFCDNGLASRLVQMISDRFQHIKIKTIHRKWFDSNTGIKLIQYLCVESYSYSLLLDLQHKYYSLAAACALLKYFETEKQIMFAAKSLKIIFQLSDNTVRIDVDTAYRLELVSSTKGHNRYSNLLGILNHCLTTGGTRLLRSTILQPPCQKEIIQTRLDSVQELINNSELFFNIKAILPKLADIDQILIICIKVPESEGLQTASAQINYTLMLKSILSCISPLIDCLQNAHGEFFLKMRNYLKHPKFSHINDQILEVIHNDAQPSKGHTGNFQRCFAVKNGINSLLDIARKTYSEIIDEMRVSVLNLSQKHNLPLTISHSGAKGIRMQMKLKPNQKNIKISQLPSEFINIREMQTIMNSVTENSLIIIDELCRGTRCDEGAAIAWAICEKLINSTAFIFFTTHLHVLTKLENVYFNVKNWNMEAIVLEQAKGERLQHTYHLKSGVTAIHRYGISTARASALPCSVIKNAMQYIEKLTHIDKLNIEDKFEDKSYDRLLYNLVAELKLPKEKNKTTDNSFKELIKRFQVQVRPLSTNDETYLLHSDIPNLELHNSAENNLNINQNESIINDSVTNDFKWPNTNYIKSVDISNKTTTISKEDKIDNLISQNVVLEKKNTDTNKHDEVENHNSELNSSLLNIFPKYANTNISQCSSNNVTNSQKLQDINSLEEIKQTESPKIKIDHSTSINIEKKTELVLIVPDINNKVEDIPENIVINERVSPLIEPNIDKNQAKNEPQEIMNQLKINDLPSPNIILQSKKQSKKSLDLENFFELAKKAKYKYSSQTSNSTNESLHYEMKMQYAHHVGSINRSNSNSSILNMKDDMHKILKNSEFELVNNNYTENNFLNLLADRNVEKFENYIEKI